eukprot:TRINITY_DN16677_c0_g1_i1.p1 TRINITY_DN16677_c0_g1~~TRINITY_DN16677_c0_g1_i1.p1  ORF type:complete len:772 (-),score=195.39 TRINITY_DN16677_c0_g1_i1:121-2373(-)
MAAESAAGVSNGTAAPGATGEGAPRSTSDVGGAGACGSGSGNGGAASVAAAPAEAFEALRLYVTNAVAGATASATVAAPAESGSLASPAPVLPAMALPKATASTGEVPTATKATAMPSAAPSAGGKGQEAITDQRCSGDPAWLSDDQLVQLFGLQAVPELNGELGRVIGFDDAVGRYRVRLLSGDGVKKITRKNLRPLDAEEAAASTSASASTARFVAPAAAAPSTPAASPSPAASSPSAAPTANDVRAAIDAIRRAVAVLELHCSARERGLAVQRGPFGVHGESISDVFLRLVTAVDIYEEVAEARRKAFRRPPPARPVPAAGSGSSGSEMRPGAAAAAAAAATAAAVAPAVDTEDAMLLAEAARALEQFEAVEERYRGLRTWAEMAQDEMNITRFNFQKHGVVGTLKQEFVEVGRDVADISRDATEALQEAVAASEAPQRLRRASTAVGGAVQQHTTAAAAAAGGCLVRGQQQAADAFQERLLAPVKRVWRLFALGLLLCFIIPLFALRTYSPLNSVVANLGLVYGAACIMCPPTWARRRGARAALLILWPLLFVLLPLVLHYWWLHPDLALPGRRSIVVAGGGDARGESAAVSASSRLHVVPRTAPAVGAEDAPAQLVGRAPESRPAPRSRREGGASESARGLARFWQARIRAVQRFLDRLAGDATRPPRAPETEAAAAAFAVGRPHAWRHRRLGQALRGAAASRAAPESTAVVAAGRSSVPSAGRTWTQLWRAWQLRQPQRRRLDM